MKKSFLNIGNKAFVNTDKIICIVAADSDKMRRILAHDNLKRHFGKFCVKRNPNR